MTPLHTACRAGHLSVVQYLIIDKGVDISNHVSLNQLLFLHSFSDSNPNNDNLSVY